LPTQPETTENEDGHMVTILPSQFFDMLGCIVEPTKPSQDGNQLSPQLFVVWLSCQKVLEDGRSTFEVSNIPPAGSEIELDPGIVGMQPCTRLERGEGTGEVLAVARQKTSMNEDGGMFWALRGQCMKDFGRLFMAMQASQACDQLRFGAQVRRLKLDDLAQLDRSAGKIAQGALGYGDLQLDRRVLGVDALAVLEYRQCASNILQISGQ
jgi:hypothetical protein